MSEMERNNPSEKQPDTENLVQLVDSIYAECRRNVDLYNSPAGIEVAIGDVVWAITYWPAWEAKPDRLTVTRDVTELDSPASYHFLHEGWVVKNEAVARRLPGGAYFDRSSETTVTDIDEIELLKAIVVATHVVHRGARDV